jgi:hypothetical protein
MVARSGSNSAASNDTAADYMRQYRTQKRLCEEANGTLRSLIKKAKSDGVNTRSMIEAVKATKLDPDVVTTDLRDQLRYMSIIHVPMTQAALFDWSDDVSEHTTRQDDEWDAQDKGYKAGRSGMRIDDVPYEPGTELHVMWREYWHKGQAAIAHELGPDVVPIGASRKRPKRGGEADAPTLVLNSDTEEADETESEAPAKRGRKPRAYVPGAGRKRGNGSSASAN